MKGYIYYTEKESLRNQLFIDELIKEAEQINIKLCLLIDDEQPDLNADFILFRDRNPILAKSFEQQGFRLFNRAEVNRIANNKLRAFELAILLGVPAVQTNKFHHVDDIASYPTVLKTTNGHGGNEVFLCFTKEEAQTFMNEFSNHELIMQPYIESDSTDIRVFMIGEEVVGAVKRTGTNSFKSNFTLGGTVDKYILSSSQVKDAIKISKALKSDYIGIDFLLLPDGSWLLNEIEDPVGARSFYKTHDESIARLLMDYIKKQLKTRQVSN